MLKGFFKSSPKDMICIDFKERGREGEGKRESEREHRCERETSIGCLLYVRQLGIAPATFCCTGRRSKQLSHLTRAKG